MGIVKFSVSDFKIYNMKKELLCEINDVKYETDILGADGEYKIKIITALEHPEIVDYLSKNHQLVTVVRSCRIRDTEANDFVRVEEFDAHLTKITRNSAINDVTVFSIGFVVITKRNETMTERKT